MTINVGVLAAYWRCEAQSLLSVFRHESGAVFFLAVGSVLK